MKVLLLCNFCGLFKQILGYLKTPGYATDLEVTHSLFYLFIFYTELGHVSVNSLGIGIAGIEFQPETILCRSWTIA